MFTWIRRARINRAQAKPVPFRWLETVSQLVPHSGCLPEDYRQRLGRMIQAFIADKRFEGAGGFEITDDVRVVIAAQACILLLGHEDGAIPYPSLRTIIVYPGAYQARYSSPLAGGLEVDDPNTRQGQWTQGGTIVLSWDHVLMGARRVDDGHNVVFHEFAHALDGEDGVLDGAPDLGTQSRYARWARVLNREYERHQIDLEFGVPTVIDGYGATKPQEFFAVVTEAFFERPRDLRAMHPELYERFQDFYQQDPAEWSCHAIS